MALNWWKNLRGLRLHLRPARGVQFAAGGELEIVGELVLLCQREECPCTVRGARQGTDRLLAERRVVAGFVDEWQQKFNRILAAGVAKSLGGFQRVGDVCSFQSALERREVATGENHPHRLHAALARGLAQRHFEQAGVLVLELEMLHQPHEIRRAPCLVQDLEHALLHGRIGVEVDSLQPRERIDGEANAVRVRGSRHKCKRGQQKRGSREPKQISKASSHGADVAQSRRSNKR